MQIVINIDEEDYKMLAQCGENVIDLGLLLRLRNLVRESKPLPKGHGRLIDVKDAVKELFDRAPTIIEADRQEQEKSYGVYEVYTWDDVSYRLIEKYATEAEAKARAAEEKQKNLEAFKPSEEMPTSPYLYVVLSNTEYCNLMGNNAEVGE